jgi:hypothetical protein
MPILITGSTSPESREAAHPIATVTPVLKGPDGNAFQYVAHITQRKTQNWLHSRRFYQRKPTVWAGRTGP